MRDLAALIVKLERASEGSREMDKDIAVEDGFFCMLVNDEWLAAETDAPVLHYTTSLDAALTLVPEIWQGLYLTWEWTGIKRESGDHKHIAFLRRGIHSYVTAGGKGASLPLALCIAALRAREYEADALKARQP